MKSKKFKAIEKDAPNTPIGKKVDLEWEGEQLQSQSDTKLEEDKGTGKPVILRFFEFGANIDSFKKHKPTAQELFNSHLQGIKSLLWRDGLSFYEDVQPRLIFSKDKTRYRFIIPCIPTQVLVDAPKTLTQLIR